jgi:hypothetical protein
MLIAAFILVMSLAATVQFAVFIWRAGLLRVAAEPVSEPMLAAETSANPLNTNDFASATAVQGLFPDLDTNAVPKFRAVRLYFSFLKLAKQIGNIAVSPGAPGFGGWTTREMALCTRYATVVLSQRLERNRMLCDEARSF